MTSGFNGYSAGSGYNLVTGLGSPIANRVVAGLLATQNVYNVTGFPAPNLTSTHLVTARITLVVNSTDGSGNTTGVGGFSNPGSSTSLFPVYPPNIVVVVIPVANTRVVLVIPTVTFSTSAFASNNHPVQHQVSTPTSFFSPGQDTFNRFGQTLPYDNPLIRRFRSLGDAELVDLIDFVEPFLPDGPVQPLDNAGRARRRQGHGDAAGSSCSGHPARPRSRGDGQQLLPGGDGPRRPLRAAQGLGR